MKFIVFGDLHGVIPKIKIKEFDAVISTGDFPANHTRKYKFQAIKQSRETNKRINWQDYLSKEKVQELLKKEDISGLKVLKFLNSINKPIFLVPGNYEPYQKEFNKIIKPYKNLINCHMKLKEYKNYNIIGYGYNSFPEIPQYELDKKVYKRRIKGLTKDYNKTKEKLTKLFKKATKPVIFITHNPPYNTPLDIVLWEGSPRYGDHLGSIITKELIEEFKPIVCCSGHMHEHFNSYKLNKTLCLNPGENTTKNVTLEIKNNKATSSLKFSKLSL